MSKPTYVPNCQYRACLNQKSGKVGTATTYIYDGRHTWHACGTCARKMAIKLGLEADPKKVIRLPFRAADVLVKRRVPKGARPRFVSRLPKRELLRRIKKAIREAPPQEKPND